MLKKVGCGMCRIIAAKVQDVARREEQGLTAGTRAFIEAHSDPTDDKANAAPANEQETIASRVIVLEAPSEISSEVADDVATTGPTARRIPAAAEPVEDTRTIE